MGALHDGHLALVTDAARRCDDVVVSIFVNPLQVNETADFASYPRPIDDDVAACAAAGVAAVYAPTASVMYPDHFQTRVVPGALADLMEGPMRPGHFEGVVTVVAKLFWCGSARYGGSSDRRTSSNSQSSGRWPPISTWASTWSDTPSCAIPTVSRSRAATGA